MTVKYRRLVPCEYWSHVGTVILVTVARVLEHNFEFLILLYFINFHRNIIFLAAEKN